LWAQGKADAAIQQEHLLDELAKTHDIEVQCGCVVGGHASKQDVAIVERICAEHSAVYSCEDHAAKSPHFITPPGRNHDLT